MLFKFSRKLCTLLSLFKFSGKIVFGKTLLMVFKFYEIICILIMAMIILNLSFNSLFQWVQCMWCFYHTKLHLMYVKNQHLWSSYSQLYRGRMNIMILSAIFVVPIKCVPSTPAVYPKFWQVLHLDMQTLKDLFLATSRAWIPELGNLKASSVSTEYYSVFNFKQKRLEKKIIFIYFLFIN